MNVKPLHHNIANKEQSLSSNISSHQTATRQELESEIIRLRRLLDTTKANLESFTMTNRATRDHCHKLTQENAKLVEKNEALGTKLRQAVQICKELNEHSIASSEKIGSQEEALVEKQESIDILNKKLEEKEEFILSICNYNNELQEQFENLEEQFSDSKKTQLSDTQKFKAVGFTVSRFHILKQKMEAKISNITQKNERRKNKSQKEVIQKNSSKRKLYWNKGLVKNSAPSAIPSTPNFSGETFFR